MATVNEHQETGAMDHAPALDMFVRWAFAEPPAEASLQTSLTPSTGSHSDSSSSEDETDFVELMFRELKLDEESKGSRLLQAAEKGAVEEVRTELAAGADVEERDEYFFGQTMLHCAAQNGHVEVVRCLLGSGAKVDTRDAWGQTALHAAAMDCGKTGEERGRAAAVRLLLASSADPNARDVWRKTPLHWAAGNGDAEVAPALLDAGADRAARDYNARTPLDIARQKNHQQLVEMLM